MVFNFKKSLQNNSGLCFKFNAGFTLIEFIIILAILAALVAISAPSLIDLLRGPKLNNASQEIINILKLAQNKTLSSEGNSQYGVYFDTSTNPHKYILFKGASFASRDSSFDQTHSVPDATELHSINLGGGNEIVFNRITGITQNPGNISVRLKEDNSKTKTIYIDSFGVISFNPPATPSDSSRTKDSRHVYFDYSRVINTATENIILTFDGSTTVTIPINSHLSGGQFYWSGVTDVGGTDQTVTIHTLRLNTPDSKFSVFRDMRFNDKSLTIKVSADNTGNLAKYTADGLTVNGLTSTDCFTNAQDLSIYVSNCLWQ